MTPEPSAKKSVNALFGELKHFQGPRDVLREKLKLLADEVVEWDDVDRMRYRQGIDVAFKSLEEASLSASTVLDELSVWLDSMIAATEALFVVNSPANKTLLERREVYAEVKSHVLEEIESAKAKEGQGT